MATSKINLMWKSFKGIRKLNSVNSDTELSADTLSNIKPIKRKNLDSNEALKVQAGLMIIKLLQTMR